MAAEREIIGDRIRNARKSCGLSQQELAELINLPSYKTVLSWESGKSLPDVEKISRICKVLNIPYEYIFDTEEDSPYSHEDLRFFNNYSSLDEFGKWVVLYNLEMQKQRCEKNQNELNLFLSADDPDYTEMKDKLSQLKALRKEKGCSYEKILFGLFSQGYEGKINLWLIFKIFKGMCIPTKKLYDDIFKTIKVLSLS